MIGANTLTLNNANNTFSGGTTIGGGTLTAGEAYALSPSSAITVNSGAWTSRPLRKRSRR